MDVVSNVEVERKGKVAGRSGSDGGEVNGSNWNSVGGFVHAGI